MLNMLDAIALPALAVIGFAVFRREIIDVLKDVARLVRSKPSSDDVEHEICCAIEGDMNEGVRDLNSKRGE